MASWEDDITSPPDRSSWQRAEMYVFRSLKQLYEQDRKLEDRQRTTERAVWIGAGAWIVLQSLFAWWLSTLGK